MGKAEFYYSLAPTPPTSVICGYVGASNCIFLPCRQRLALPTTSVCALGAAFMRARHGFHLRWVVLAKSYKARLSPEKESQPSITSRLEKLANCSAEMATSFSTLASTSSLLRVKIIQYDPSAPKPKPKSRAKPKMKTKMVEHNLSKVGSLTDYGGWLDIDAFPVLDFDATSSLDPEVPAPFGAAGPFNSLDQGSIRPLKVRF